MADIEMKDASATKEEVKAEVFKEEEPHDHFYGKKLDKFANPG